VVGSTRSSSARRQEVQRVVVEQLGLIEQGCVIVMSPGFQTKRSATFGSILSGPAAASAYLVATAISAEVRNRSRR
jgi:hypothetical protein